jgi:hypothetical protein
MMVILWKGAHIARWNYSTLYKGDGEYVSGTNVYKLGAMHIYLCTSEASVW